METLFSPAALLGSLRRRWWLVLLVVLASGAGSGWFARRLPKVYRASTLILVEPQKIPAAYVRPTVTTSIEGRLRSLRQQITSRTRIEKVIREVDLFPDQIDVVPIEGLVGRVVSRLNLETRGDSTFRIWYEGTEPKQVADVANKIAEIFIRENTYSRQRLAEGTSEFLEAELERVRKQLEEDEEALARFKAEHMGELPEQRESNLRTLEALQGRLRTNSESLARAKDRRLALQSQMEDAPAGATDVNQVAAQLEQAEIRLRDLLTRYTERHPDVVQEKREVEKLRAQLDQEPREPEADSLATRLSPYQARLRTELAAVDNEIKVLESEERQVRADIVRYQQRVENAPRNEALLSKLTRDNDNLRANYQSLLNKKLEAELAEKLERELQGEQFIIVDRAIPPALPYKPNVLQIVTFGIAGGLLAGCGLVVLLDVARPRYRSEAELVGAYGIPVLATVPLLTPELSRRHRAVRMVLVTSGVAVALIAAVLIALFVAMSG